MVGLSPQPPAGMVFGGTKLWRAFRDADHRGRSAHGLTVGQMLAWPVGPTPAANAPRTGRELTLYHIAIAYLQNARLISFDCDLHFELSDVAAKTAPRVIVETPIDSEYCPSRRTIASQLDEHHFRLRALLASEAELPQALPVSVLGLAFQDFEHDRGNPK